jgi:dipeptidyl aminopeptidase/acylaminoacyl peptidase
MTFTQSRLAIALTLLLLAATIRAEDPADPQRPAAIETTGVPAIPAELLKQLDRYENVRGAGFSSWSPDGKGMLIRTRFANSPQLHRVYVPGGRREQITFYEEPVDGGFIPRAKDGAILLTMSSGGSENNQVYYFDQQNYKTELLTDGKSRYGLGPTNADGSRIILSSNERNGRDTDLYLADPRTPGKRELIFETDKQFWYAADWSQDGSTLLLGRFVSANESYPALYDLKTKKRTELKLPSDGPAAIADMAFSPDAKHVYIATDADSEFRRLARLEIATGKYTWLTEDLQWDVNELAVSDKTGAVAVAINEDGASRLFVFEGESPEKLKRRELKMPLGIVSSLEFSPDGTTLGITFARPAAPADAYSIDVDSGELTQWTFSEIGGLDPSKFVVPDRIRFKSFDGREIPAYYYRPKVASGKNPAGVLITIHGGPESQFQPYFSGALQFFVNELGLAVIAPNVRGSSGYGKTYLKLDNADKREDSVKDIGALLDWIGEQTELDASRVAVSGGSYGGYVTLASLVHYGDRLKAGVDTVGIANFITFLESTAAYRQDLRRVEYGDERDPAMRKTLVAISPLTRADEIKSALLVIHGKNDPRVPFGEAQQIADKVRANGRPVWTVYAGNEGHGFAKKDNADYARAVQVMFLKEHLGRKTKAAADHTDATDRKEARQ